MNNLLIKMSRFTRMLVTAINVVQLMYTIIIKVLRLILRHYNYKCLNTLTNSLMS